MLAIAWDRDDDRAPAAGPLRQSPPPAHLGSDHGSGAGHRCALWHHRTRRGGGPRHARPPERLAHRRSRPHPKRGSRRDVADALRNPISALAGSGGSNPHPRSRRAGGGRAAHAGASRVPLRGRSGDTLVRPLDFWVGQDVDAAECVCWCQTRSAEHGVHPHPTRVVRLVQDGQHSQLRSVSEQAAPGASTLPVFRRAAQVKASALPCVQAPRL